MTVRILLLKPPIFNVGDGFVAKGAKAQLENLPFDVEIIESSAFSNRIARWAGGHSDRWLDRTTGIADLVDVDLAVLPGCTLFRGAMLEHSRIFQQLAESETPIILLGAGGFDFTNEEKTTVRKYLQQGHVDAIISRNPAVYEAYANNVNYTYEGIDCAFFIDDWAQPSQADQNFVASTFLSVNEPDLNSDREIIRPNHEPFLLLPQTELLEFSHHSEYADRLINIYLQLYGSDIDVVDKIPLLNQLPANFPSRNLQKSVIEEFKQGNVFMSGELAEYLFIYKNATEVHTERVHATIPSLVYGTPVKFYLETPRAGLFQEFVNKQEEFWTLNQELFEEAKARQLSILENLVTELTD